MKDAMTHLPEIVRRVSRHGCILMLDFDGTLAPYVRHPENAAMPTATRAALVAATQRFPVAIISGRPLSDIRRRVRIRKITYAGSHGFEWSIEGKKSRFTMPKSIRDALTRAERVWKPLYRTYPQLIFERKYASRALNYRALAPKAARAFRRQARALVSPFVRPGKLRIMDAHRTFELQANVRWSKGHAARMLADRLNGRARPQRVPIYIGDSLTDEDAFKALKSAITIRVKKGASAAHFYLKDRNAVASFIACLSDLVD